MNVLIFSTKNGRYQIGTPLSVSRYYAEKIKDKNMIMIDDILHGRVIIHVEDIMSIDKVDEINYGEDVELFY